MPILVAEMVIYDIYGGFSNNKFGSRQWKGGDWTNMNQQGGLTQSRRFKLTTVEIQAVSNRIQQRSWAYTHSTPFLWYDPLGMNSTIGLPSSKST